MNTNTAIETTETAAPAADPLTDPRLPGALAELRELVAQLGASLVERTHQIRVILIALLACEHVIQFGPPGVAKSDLLRKVCGALYAGIARAYFGITMSKFTAPEDLWGPVSASRYMNEDRYERIVAGYAPAARIWGLDEPFQASDSILQTMVTAMQERKFKNGEQEIDIPLEMIAAATNEYPESPSLAKVYDRFALRVWVDEVRDRDARRLLYRRRGSLPVTATLAPESLAVLRAAARAIPWGDREADKLAAIQEALEAEGFRASPRTWTKAAWIIPCAALFAGRTQVAPADYLILADMVWQRAEERDRVLSIVGNAADPYGARAEAIVDGVRAAMAGLPSLDLLRSGQKTKADLIKVISPISGQVAAKMDQIHEVIAEAGESDALVEAREAVEAAMRRIDELTREVQWFRAR